MTNPAADFVIITALEEERDALLDKLPGYQRLNPSVEDIRVYYLSNLPVTFPDGSTGAYQVVVTSPVGMGRVQATAATSDAIRRWRPRYVILVGAAGGIAAKKVALGDILVSEQIVDYELQKLTPQGPQVRWSVHRADSRLLSAVNSFNERGWQELITRKRPGRGEFKRHIGPIASGDKAIAFSEVLSQYRNVWPELIGVEMEAAGVATASFQAPTQPGFLMVRAVSELADQAKGPARAEQWRAYACEAAATYLVTFLRSGPVLPAPSGQATVSAPTVASGKSESFTQEASPLPPAHTPQILNQQSFSLPPEAETILKEIFAGYERVVIDRELGGGFSGGKVFLVHPVRSGNIRELPSVIKLASVSLIQSEWQAYHTWIRDRLPNSIGIRDKPVLPPGSDWGGLRYPLAGGGTFPIQSCHHYCREASIEDIRLTFEKRLLRVIEQIMQYHQVSPLYNHQASYDPIPPVNLLLKPAAPPPGVSSYFLTPATLPASPLKANDYVHLEGFVITKVDLVDHTITLNLPASTSTPPGASYLVRLQSVEGMGAYEVNQVIKPVTSIVIQTRQERLWLEAQRALGSHVDLSSPTLISPGGATLPNPLAALPRLLSGYRDVKVGCIHGDLNLENILVDPTTHDVSLIDFAAARQDYLLHDFFRLETEIATKFIPEILVQAGLGAEVVPSFYFSLHEFILRPGQFGTGKPLYAALEKPLAIITVIRQAAHRYLLHSNDWAEYYQGLALYLLGAMKFGNLDKIREAPAPLPKQVAFWGAAATLKLMENPARLETPDRPRETVSQPPTGQATTGATPTVFISYSRKDERQKDQLLSHLKVLKQTGIIDLWSDDRIGAGAAWEQEINRAMAQASIAILLISANFLSSEFVLRNEVNKLLERRQHEGLIIFPVIAKACAWKTIDWLARLQVVPRSGKPIWGSGSSRVDENLAQIAQDIAAIIEKK